MCRISIVASCDIDNHLFLDVCVQKLAKKNERSGAIERMAAVETPAIFVMDCGFHGFSLESKIMNLDHFFLIRMKEGDSHSLLQIPEE